MSYLSTRRRACEVAAAESNRAGVHGRRARQQVGDGQRGGALARPRCADDGRGLARAGGEAEAAQAWKQALRLQALHEGEQGGVVFDQLLHFFGVFGGGFDGAGGCCQG